jgi:ADP-ribose pyrophosphatase
MARNKKEWRKLSTLEIFKTKFFRFRSDELELPNKVIQPRYYVMEFSDWVNIVALTTKNELILIRQYRHAVEEICLEIPGGSVNPGSGEATEAAALRELTEETGYVPSEMKLLGYHEPNPALMSNKLWTYLALGCEKVKEQELDPYEDIEVITCPPKEVFKLIKSGEIRHSLVIAALHLAQDYLKPEIR